MAGRIRTIKPEWLEDERMVLASPAARVLSIGLILLADDHGRGVGNADLISSRIFPGHSRESREAFRELLDMGFFRLYTVRGQTFFEIANWTKHQRVDKPGKPRVPDPCEADAKVPGSLAKVPGSLATDHDHDHDHDHDQEGESEGEGNRKRSPSGGARNGRTRSKSEHARIASIVIDQFNRSMNQRRDPKTWVGHVGKALAAGHSQADMIAAIYAVADWPDNVKANASPATILRLNNREGKNCLPQWAEKGREDWREAHGEKPAPWEHQMALEATNG